MSPPIAEVDATATKHTVLGPDGKRPGPGAQTPGNPFLGAVLMTGAAALFAALNTLVKYASSLGMDPLQISFLRSFFAAVTMLPILVGPVRRNGFRHLMPTRFWLMTFRGLSSAVGVIVWMTAVTLLPLTEVTAISFTAPLIATVGSALILGEVVRARRWSAVAIGFVGVLIILRPGMIPLDVGFLWAITAAVFMAMAALIIKLLTRAEPPDRIVFWTNVWLTVGTLIPALTVWQTMTWEFWVIGIAMGVTGAISHILLTYSFSVADASIVLPFDYARLPFVAVLGYAFFGQVSDLYTWGGAALIAASAIYVARREQQVAKRARIAAAAAAETD